MFRVPYRRSPISQGRRAHRAEAIELVNNDIVLTVTLERHRRRRIHSTLTRLSLLRRERLLKGVYLFLFPYVDLVLRRGRVHEIQLPVVLHGGDGVLR